MATRTLVAVGQQFPKCQQPLAGAVAYHACGFVARVGFRLVGGCNWRTSEALGARVARSPPCDFAWFRTLPANPQHAGSRNGSRQRQPSTRIPNSKHPHSCFGIRAVDCPTADPDDMKRNITPGRAHYVVMQEKQYQECFAKCPTRPLELGKCALSRSHFFERTSPLLAFRPDPRSIQRCSL